MGGQTGPQSQDEDISTSSIDSMVEIKHTSSYEQPAEEDRKHSLLFSKSKVYIHPTAYAQDNIPGFVAIVRKDGLKPSYLLAWIPESLLEEQGREEWEKFAHVEAEATEDDAVLVELPSKQAETYAFSVSLGTVYSFIIHPPSFSSWYGSITVNLSSGETLPTLFFHDDESRSFNSVAPGSSIPQSKWGGEDLLVRLRNYCNILRSSLQDSLYLVDPSRQDLETHTTHLFSDDAVDEILSPTTHTPRHGRRSRPQSAGNNGKRMSVLHQTLASPSPAFQAGNSILQGFSQITRGARTTAQRILSHPLAKPITPYLPEPVNSFINANGEWASWVEKGGVGEYESARVYLARWARIVAEEGERSRQREIHAKSRLGDEDEEDSGLGVFEVIRKSGSLPISRTTRNPKNPIDRETWSGWFAGDGRPIVPIDYMRQEVFRRGCAYDVRQKAWPFILGALPWDVDEREREILWTQLKTQYYEIKSEWFGVEEVFNRPDIQDERHRIDVDCRRTDRTQPLFAAPSNPPTPGASDGASGSGAKPVNTSKLQRPFSFSPTPEEIGSQAPANEHTEMLCEILLTYGFYEKDLGYVQGMSDLCAPLYVIQKGDEVMTFWCFVALMKRMKQNFLRDQSGMKKQLATLQQLLGVMDPELYKHFEKTDSLNLFFCFRWVLITFKREFPFDDVLGLWEVLWTDHYSTQFVLFVALAVLESHRDFILRYLVEFDEILKYCNQLSMTIELDSTLAQAEILFLSFKKIVQDIDRRQAELLDPTSAGVRRRNVHGAEGSSAETDTGAGASAGGHEAGTSEGPSSSTRDGNVVANLKQLPFISENLRELIRADW